MNNYQPDRPTPEEKSLMRVRRGVGNVLTILVGLVGFIASLIEIYSFLVQHPGVALAIGSGMTAVYQNLIFLTLFAFLVAVPILERRADYQMRAAQALAAIGIVTGTVLSVSTGQNSLFASLLFMAIGFTPYVGNLMTPQTDEKAIDFVDVEFMALIGAFLGIKSVFVFTIGWISLGMYGLAVLIAAWITQGTVVTSRRIYTTPIMATTTLSVALFFQFSNFIE